MEMGMENCRIRKSRFYCVAMVKKWGAEIAADAEQYSTFYDLPKYRDNEKVHS